MADRTPSKVLLGHKASPKVADVLFKISPARTPAAQAALFLDTLLTIVPEKSPLTLRAKLGKSKSKRSIVSLSSISMSISTRAAALWIDSVSSTNSSGDNTRPLLISRNVMPMLKMEEEVAAALLSGRVTVYVLLRSWTSFFFKAISASYKSGSSAATTALWMESRAAVVSASTVSPTLLLLLLLLLLLSYSELPAATCRCNAEVCLARLRLLGSKLEKE